METAIYVDTWLCTVYTSCIAFKAKDNGFWRHELDSEEIRTLSLRSGRLLV